MNLTFKLILYIKLVLLFISFSFRVNSQSLYSDALRLADLIRNRAAPKIDYSRSTIDTTNLNIFFNKRMLGWSDNGALEQPGLYEIYGFQGPDTLVLKCTREI